MTTPATVSAFLDALDHPLKPVLVDVVASVRSRRSTFMLAARRHRPCCWFCIAVRRRAALQAIIREWIAQV
jgi:hypothetical protein